MSINSTELRKQYPYLAPNELSAGRSQSFFVKEGETTKLLEGMNDLIPDRLKPKAKENYALKDFMSGDEWIEVPYNPYQGVVESLGNIYSVIRSVAWLTEEDEVHATNGWSGQRPAYSRSILDKVVNRSIEDDRSLLEESPPKPVGAGNETEFFAVVFVEDEIVPVDIQNVLKEVSDYMTNTSVEAWKSQAEIPSSPRGKNQDRYDHLREIAEEHWLINRIFREMGVTLLPTAVAPYLSKGQANFGHPHVLRAVWQNLISINSPEKVSKEQAAEVLEGFASSGTHITIDLEKVDGQVGDELLNEVYNHTHGKASVLLKAFTLSGNMSSADDLEGGLSRREEMRRKLPTSQVGVTKRIFDPDTKDAVIRGKSQALERASKFGRNARGELVAAGAVHDPVGRQKEKGMNEFTIFDTEPNLEKVTLLESVLTMYTIATQRAAVRDSENPLSLERKKQEIGEKADWFLSVLQDNNVFQQLATVVDRDGFNGVVDFCGEDRTVANVLEQFLDFIEEFSAEQGLTEEHGWGQYYEDLNMLRGLLTNLERPELIANNFYDYFDPNADQYMNGNVAMVAQRFYLNKVDEYQRKIGFHRTDLARRKAHRDTLKEMADAYYWYTGQASSMARAA